jgi:hypothetical protein
MASLTLQEQLAAQIKERGDLIAAIASISANTNARKIYVNKMINEGNYAEANKVSGQIDQDEAIKSGYVARVKELDESIKGLQAAINAQTALVNANANLTPEQLTQIKLNEQNQAAAAAAAKAKAEAEAKNFAAENTKYYIIAAVVVLVVIVAIVMFSKNGSKPAAVAAAA